MKKKILIIEDEPVTRELLKSRLSFSGFEVDAAPDGESGLKKMKETKPDLVVLDILMPGINGYEVCQRAKKDPETKAIPIIFLTTAAQPEAIKRGKAVGGDGYITKPYEGSGLVDEIEKFLEK